MTLCFQMIFQFICGNVKDIGSAVFLVEPWLLIHIYDYICIYRHLLSHETLEQMLVVCMTTTWVENEHGINKNWKDG